MAVASLRPRTAEQVEALVLADHHRYKGKAIFVRQAIARRGSSHLPLQFDPPLLALIDSEVDCEKDLLRWNRDQAWCDPFYRIRPLLPDRPELLGLTEIYVIGPSRGVDPMHDDYWRNCWSLTCPEPKRLVRRVKETRCAELALA
ncbi:MAG TPA: hypothetical protein VHB77_14960 [Planctomycetaceae bacterium]|nr:hypothetical protein [Planctomycetaceae bacterium]